MSLADTAKFTLLSLKGGTFLVIPRLSAVEIEILDFVFDGDIPSQMFQPDH